MLYYKAGKFDVARDYFYKSFLEYYKNPKIATKAIVAFFGKNIFDIMYKIWGCFRFRKIVIPQHVTDDVTYEERGWFACKT